MQAIVDKMKDEEGGPFNKLQCPNKVKTVEKHCDDVMSQLDPNVTNDHKGQEGATDDSPGVGEPRDPHEDTEQEILDGLQDLDNHGFIN